MQDNPSDLFSQKYEMPPEKPQKSLPVPMTEGEIHRIVFTNEDESYSIVKVKENSGAITTLTGPLSGVFEGQGIKAWGKWEKHPEYGQYLRVENFSFTLPRTNAGIETYISSGIIRGIGPKKAKMIVRRFGEKTLDILDNYSSRLAEIPGFGKKIIEGIKKSWQEQSEKREVTIYFQELGISIAYCNRIYKYFGKNALKMVKNNPYALAELVSGIGFIRADNIAKNLGIGHNDLKRLTAGIKYTFTKLSEAGHTCYPLTEFVKITAETLQVSEEESRKGIANAEAQKECMIDTITSNSITGLFAFDRFVREAELQLARIISGFCSSKTHKAIFLKDIPLPKEMPLKFNEEQLAAINNISASPVSVITGGPGVGKTTVIREIIRRAIRAKLRIFLCAPTGRASKRMSEATNFRAQTIHRLLKWDPVEKSFVFNQNNKLKADIVVLDECSMLDMQLALNLFKAVKPGTTVVLVGDVDQLPSVGAGNVLKDIIASGICPVTFLRHIYRQDAQSKIITVAHQINRGKLFNFENEQKETLSDFYWIDQDEPQKVSELIIKMISERIPARFGFNPMEDIQILSPMSKGICGTIALNERLQSALNHNAHLSFNYGSRFFKTGDKVMQTSNNYDKNVFNGDIGFIHSINKTDSTFTVKFENRFVPYDFDESVELTLAYAVTIHKSQGCEFPAVIVPCIMSHYIMLQRNLLYTAVSRAKKLLILIGSKKALSIAVSNYKYAPRFTSLCCNLTDVN